MRVRENIFECRSLFPFSTEGVSIMPRRAVNRASSNLTRRKPSEIRKNGKNMRELPVLEHWENPRHKEFRHILKWVEVLRLELVSQHKVAAKTLQEDYSFGCHCDIMVISWGNKTELVSVLEYRVAWFCWLGIRRRVGKCSNWTSSDYWYDWGYSMV